MSKRLFRVNCVVDMVVLADNENDAADLAEYHARDEVNNGLEIWSIVPIEKAEQLPSGWRGAYPYGGDGEKMCREIIGDKP